MSDKPEDEASMEAQERAFEEYRAAKLRLDADVTIVNARIAAAAWWTFLTIFERVTAEQRSR